MINFYLNRETTYRQVTARSDTTVLQYLRANGLVGTKEGCASGDCGACTAVLAQVVDGALQYSSVNTCILLLSALQGKWLITVDGLSDSDALHPVQEAMVQAHGSQCGFCTPGFVMSLFAMSKQPPATPNRDDVRTAIAGNLCRCTGYRPIVDAGLALLADNSTATPDYFDSQHAQKVQALQALPPSTPTHDDTITIAPDAQTLATVKTPDIKIVAGGTDLSLDLTVHEKQMPKLVDISHLSAECQETDSQWILPATATIASCMAFFATRLPDLIPYLHRFGSMPIRARATIGGNIGNASPIADMPPVLLALDATLTLTDGAQTRQLPLSDFYLDYKQTALKSNEWIEAITINKPVPNSIFKVFKISKRIEDDISIISAAMLFSIDQQQITHARVAYGGMAAIPKRAVAVETALLGQAWDSTTIHTAAQQVSADFSPITDVRGSAEYRLTLAAAVLQRAYHESTTPTPRIESPHLP